MKTFPGLKIENLINRVCFRMGSTPARSAMRCSQSSVILLSLLSIEVSTRFALVISDLSINRLLGYSLWFSASLVVMLSMKNIRDWVCGGNLSRYFSLVGAVLLFHVASNEMVLPFTPGLDRLIFIIALSWMIAVEFYNYCQGALAQEKAVLERGNLPQIKPRWLAGFFLFATVLALLLILSVYKWWGHWFLIANLAVLAATWALLAAGCLAAACTPRPPTRAGSLSARIWGLFSHTQPASV